MLKPTKPFDSSNLPMKAFHCSVVHCCLGIALLIPVAAQESPSAAAAAPIELSAEELVQRIPLVEAQIEDRELRAVELTNDIISLDKRIEGRIDRVLKMLKGMKDSNESGTRVVRLKKEALAGLANTIDVYDSKRRDMKMEAYARDPKIEREELFKSVARYDERIEKRVNQILDLAKTFTEHKNYSKYIHSHSGGHWGGSTRRRNPAYSQNRSQTIHTEQTRQQLIDALKKSIESVDIRNRSIRERMRSEMTDQFRVLLEEELEHNGALIEVREQQIVGLLKGPSGGGKAVSTRVVMTTEKMIEELVVDIRADSDDLFAGIRELTEEKAYLKYLRERLEVAKQAAAEQETKTAAPK
jgi:hypothetical protein